MSYIINSKYLKSKYNSRTLLKQPKQPKMFKLNLLEIIDSLMSKFLYPFDRKKRKHEIETEATTTRQHPCSIHSPARCSCCFRHSLLSATNDLSPSSDFEPSFTLQFFFSYFTLRGTFFVLPHNFNLGPATTPPNYQNHKPNVVL